MILLPTQAACESEFHLSATRACNASLSRSGTQETDAGKTYFDFKVAPEEQLLADLDKLGEISL